MTDIFSLLKRKKEKIFLTLDIGTESLKGLICKKKGEKIIILKSSLEYFEQFGIFDSRDFEKDILKKAISKTLENFTFQKLENLPVILGLLASFFKARIVSQTFKREKPEKKIDKKEEKEILERVLTETKKRISQTDIQFINFQILERKIEGYQVAFLKGYKGKNLDFRILATFLTEFSLEKIRAVLKNFQLPIPKIVHLAEGIIFLAKEVKRGIFLDVGGKITQIFLVKDGQLKAIEEFELGGGIFSQVLSEKFGLREKEAQILKERYSKKELSKESSERIREILSFPLQNWFRNLKSKLREINGEKLLPSNFFLFGGGSLLPEIQEILETGNWEEIVFEGRIQTKLFYPKDLRDVEIVIPALNSPQIIPTILLIYAKQKNF